MSLNDVLESQRVTAKKNDDVLRDLGDGAELINPLC